MDDPKLKYKDLTEKIIGCAYKIYNHFGFGFLESVYEKALVLELNAINIKVKSQMPIEVFYQNQSVGLFIADLVVEDKIIIELKSVQQISKAHEVQLVNYLVATGIETGLLINFGEEKVEVKRKYKERKHPENPVNPV
jgi:GxxExxY protein